MNIYYVFIELYTFFFKRDTNDSLTYESAGFEMFFF